MDRLVGRNTEAIVLWKSATETAAWKTLTRVSCSVSFSRLAVQQLAWLVGQGRSVKHKT
ncbi:MAG: hypothetical protein NTV10_08635 [Methanoregula sp.]|nr:hypothetical protein [Methanoregula sp.]